MNHRNWITIPLLLVATSVLAGGPTNLSPYDGEYRAMNVDTYRLLGMSDTANTNYLLGGVYAGQEFHTQTTPGWATYVCAGNGSALTPGKLVKGYCYWPNNSDEKRDETYHYLVANNYEWKRADSVANGDSAVTSRDWDAGSYIYHCRAYDHFSYADKVKVGKYVPGTGKCYWGWFDEEYSESNPFWFDILVPTASSSPAPSVGGSGGGGGGGGSGGGYIERN